MAVRLPAEFEGDGEAEDGAVVRQWITVTLAAEELVWLREALALIADDDDPDDDSEGLDPLD